MLDRAFDRFTVWLAGKLGNARLFVASFILCAFAIGAATVPSLREAVNTWAGALSGYIGVLLLLINQNAQNRTGLATQIKLDEIIAVLGPARNALIRSEEKSVKEIEELRITEVKD